MQQQQLPVPLGWDGWIVLGRESEDSRVAIWNFLRGGLEFVGLAWLVVRENKDGKGTDDVTTEYT